MDIFVGNLPDKIDAGALEKLFHKFCKTAHTRFFKNQNHSAKMRYACISISPVKHAKRAIRILNKSVFDGKIILVREFHHRASFNERRAIGCHNKQWKDVEKRTNDRRGYLVEELNSGVHLVEIKALEQSQAEPRAKDKKTPLPVRQASRGHQA